MSGPEHGDRESAGSGEGHGKHGVLAMIACCIPMIAVIVWIALR